MPTETTPDGARAKAKLRTRLRRELVWALVLKLIVLMAIKFVFFPHRLSASDMSRGVEQRVASDAGLSGKASSKESP